MFNGQLNDLREKVAYERVALETVRKALFAQSEAPTEVITSNLSQLCGDTGQPLVEVSRSSQVSFSDSAVKAVLGEMRPLLFSAAFKVNDMIAEWILRANGCWSWPFSAKIQFYNRAVAANRLSEPAEFVAWPAGATAFWRLYSALADCRNILVHRNAFEVIGDDLCINDGRTTINLTHDQQSAYVRAMCLFSDGLTNGAGFPVYEKHLLESDLAKLQLVHNAQGLITLPVKRRSVVIHSPVIIGGDGNERLEVDFDQIERIAATDTIAGSLVLFDLTLVGSFSSGDVKWVFPVGDVPTGTIVVNGPLDSYFALYLK